MSLSHLLAGIWFVLVGLVYTEIVTASHTYNLVLGILAIVVGILYILEASSVWSYNIPARNRQA